MAKGHLKFRCYRCNQLLGASTRRAGMVISCPRCSAELEVPQPDEPATSAAAKSPTRPSSRGRRNSAVVPSTSAAVSSFIEEITAAIPEELAALRPEDVRVEAEFANRVVKPREPAIPILPPRVETPPDPEAPSVEALQAAQTAQAVQLTRRVETPPQALVRPDPPLSIAVEQAQPALRIDSSLPTIQVDPPSILARGRTPRQASEVVLQPAIILAWSLLVLIAVPMAFVAGLLLGHFVWK